MRFDLRKAEGLGHASAQRAKPGKTSSFTGKLGIRKEDIKKLL